jgi:hypothetical protein
VGEGTLHEQTRIGMAFTKYRLSSLLCKMIENTSILSLSQLKTFTPQLSNILGDGGQSPVSISRPANGMQSVWHMSRTTVGPAVAVSASMLFGLISGSKDFTLK